MLKNNHTFVCYRCNQNSCNQTACPVKRSYVITVRKKDVDVDQLHVTVYKPENQGLKYLNNHTTELKCITLVKEPVAQKRIQKHLQ